MEVLAQPSETEQGGSGVQGQPCYIVNLRKASKKKKVPINKEEPFGVIPMDNVHMHPTLQARRCGGGRLKDTGVDPEPGGWPPHLQTRSLLLRKVSCS